jgi:hypothetical protein
MAQNREYIFLPKYSIKPNKIVYFNEVSWYGKADKKVSEPSQIKAKPTVEKKFHGFQISHTAQKTLIEKVNWLYQLGKSRYVKTYSGKEIFNFKINFLTLTLPFNQSHPTSQITNECFNQFLTEVRSRTKMENYVWRLEFQSNGNVHYHIVTDTYIDYFFALKIWNRIINKLGYVDQYREKMSKLSLYEYHVKYGENIGRSFEQSAKIYAKAKADKWQNPPSVDVKSCSSKNSIGFYIGKYFSKKEKTPVLQNPLDNESNSFGLRLWFCSRSLSKLKGIVEYLECANFCPKTLLLGIDKVRRYFHKYAECLYFEFSQLTNYAKSVLFPIMFEYAKSLGYSSAGFSPVVWD